MLGTYGAWQRLPAHAEPGKIADVYTLNVLKLFRRALIEQLGVRFDETVSGGEDGPFAAKLLLSAKVISVVGNYRCYYCRDRPGSQTKRKQTRTRQTTRSACPKRAQLLAEHRPPGLERDRLMSRHIRDMMRPFHLPWLSMTPDDHRRVFEVGRRLLDEWSNARIEAMLAAVSMRYVRTAYATASSPQWKISSAHRRSRPWRSPSWTTTACSRTSRTSGTTIGIPDSCFELTQLIELRSRIKHAEVTGGKLDAGRQSTPDLSRRRHHGRSQALAVGERNIVTPRRPTPELHTGTTIPVFPPRRIHHRNRLDNHPSGGRLCRPGHIRSVWRLDDRRSDAKQPAKFAKRRRPGRFQRSSARLKARPTHATLYRATDGSLRGLRDGRRRDGTLRTAAGIGNGTCATHRPPESSQPPTGVKEEAPST